MKPLISAERCVPLCGVESIAFVSDGMNTYVEYENMLGNGRITNLNQLYHKMEGCPDHWSCVNIKPCLECALCFKDLSAFEL